MHGPHTYIKQKTLFSSAMGQTKYVHATLIKHPSLSFYVNNCRSHRILIDATSRIFREITISVFTNSISNINRYDILPKLIYNCFDKTYYKLKQNQQKNILIEDSTLLKLMR